MSQKKYFAALEEIYNNVVSHWSSFLISCLPFNNTPYLFYIKIQLRDQFFLYMDPVYAFVRQRCLRIYKVAKSRNLIDHQRKLYEWKRIKLG